MAERPDVMMIGFRSLGGSQGGVEAHVANLIEQVDRAGYTVDAVVRSPYPQHYRIGTRTRMTQIWSPRGHATEALGHSLLAIAYAGWRRPHIVHIHAVGPALVVPLARMLGLRVVVTHHGEDYKREKWGRLGRGALLLGEYCAAHFAHQRICVSRSLSARLSADYRGEFRFIPNGVQRHKPVDTTSTLKRFGLTPNSYILHVGRLVPEKRQLDLIAALRALDDPEMKLVLAGAADHESLYSKAVLSAAKNHPQVVMTGIQTGTALAELFSHAAVFALPSTHEGLPIALLEALSYGRTVIASDIEANLNMNLPAACYFEAGDIDDLIRVLRNALSCAAGRRAIDWSAILREYDWSDVGRKTIDVYAAATRGWLGRSGRRRQRQAHAAQLFNRQEQGNPG